MQEKVNRITSLIEKYLEEQLSHTEQQELNEWLAEAESNRLFFQQITDKEILREKMKLYAGADSAAIWHKTMQEIDGGKLVTMYPQKYSFRKYVAAAAAIILVSAGTWFYLGKQSKSKIAQTESTDATLKTLIVPGGNKATLELSDGKTIVLATASNGELAKQGSTLINKIDGRLIYNREQNDAHQNIDNAFNTITTPRGGEYQVTLPDGSKVWINAASSLRFPIVFAGNERIVELTGEAYFEVNPQLASAKETTKATKKPFIVKLIAPSGASSQVQVLGTHFNVMAYSDEALIKTTLLEGAVKVSSGNSSQTIKPGEQALMKKDDISVRNVDGDDVIAWTNGFIPVGGTDLDFAMRQIGRWYDVQIEYEGTIPHVVFEGKLPRTASITDVIKVLNANNIKARLDEKERKIVITS